MSDTMDWPLSETHESAYSMLAYAGSENIVCMIKSDTLSVNMQSQTRFTRRFQQSTSVDEVVFGVKLFILPWVLVWQVTNICIIIIACTIEGIFCNCPRA